MTATAQFFEKRFPRSVIRVEGLGAYARNATLGSMGHVDVALDLLAGRPRPVCLDIGANIGLTALLMDQKIDGGRIFAFEPHPATHARLARNIAANQGGGNAIETFALALGRTEDRLRFSDFEQISQGNSFIRDGSLAAEAQPGIEVPVRRLDDLDPARGAAIDLIKIDVEGFELDVLAGAGRTLERSAMVLMEFNHWCLSAMARVFPEDALKTLTDRFEGVFVFEPATRRYRRIATPQERWNFLHDNMVKDNVNDLLCSSDPRILAALSG